MQKLLPKFDLIFPKYRINRTSKTKTYYCKQIKVSACLITMQSSNISNKSICTLSRDPAIFHVQKAAKYCRASSLMWVSPSHWWTANWQIYQPWVWKYYF